MTNERHHSRGGPASGHGARSGAGQIHGDVDGADVNADEDAEQKFARTGQFTGRAIPPQDPADAAAADDAFRRAAAAASPPPSTDEIARSFGEVAPGTAPGATPGVEDVVRERDQYRADLQRLAADFDNFRKRSQREREQAATAADARLLGELLAVLDDFERALAHAGEAPAGSPQSQLADGIRMTHSRLWGVLAQHGLQEIQVGGMFDPHLHDAMMMQAPPPGVESGTVLQVVQKGYMLGDRVLRHAKVIVAGEA